MPSKGNQPQNGVDRRQANQKKKLSTSTSATTPDRKEIRKASEVESMFGEEFSEEYNSLNSRATDDKTNIDESSEKVQKRDKIRGHKRNDLDDTKSFRYGSINCESNSDENPGSREEYGTFLGGENDPKQTKVGFGYLLNAFLIKKLLEKLEFSGDTVVRRVRISASSVLNAVGDWLEKQRPLFVTIRSSVLKARDYTKLKINKAYPFVLKCLFHFGTIVLLLLVFWLNSTLRGIDSFLRLGTTSFFSVLWCSIFSAIAMIGAFKFLIVLVIAAPVGAFIGLTLALLIVAVAGIISLWFYGSFWTTSCVMIAGGLAFLLRHERIALLIATVYSIYSVLTYVGWFGLLLALNLSFISTDIMIYFLKSNIDWQRRSNRHTEYTTGAEGRPGFFSGEPPYTSFAESGPSSSMNRGPGIPSTTGSDAELTSEDEIIRLLNCTDHYSALGISRYENVDNAVLKREYRKKAMLVHPDKNNGNEKAAEAFKKLQNAYEVLLDTLKRKVYDDELRREEVLNYFRRFQNTFPKNGEHSFSPSGFASPDADGVGLFGDSRRIACKKCGNFHVWRYTNKSKSKARWCQDCKEYHQAKDGDGWVEQSCQTFLFGLLQKVDAAAAYICAESKIYDATEWYICQGMRCPANTHKPSFHVNTSVTSKHSTGKGSRSGQRSGRMPNVEETVTEEEFFEWLQNAVEAGVFDNFNEAAMSSGSPSSRATNVPKSGSHGSSSSFNKRKKKGKKQR